MTLTKASITMQAACAAKATDKNLCLQDPIGFSIYSLLPEADGYRATIDKNSNDMFSETVRFRKQYFSDALKKYAHDYSQLIILSCGLDFGCLSHQEWQTKLKFLIDHPLSLEFSLPLLKKVSLIPEKTNFLSIDLELENSAEKIKKTLLLNNFDTEKSTLILWEGATYYLDKTATLRVIKTLSQLIPNVRIIFDYVLSIENTAQRSEADELKGLNENLNYIKKNNEAWKTTFSTDELNAQLKKMSFRQIITATDIEIQKSYGLTLENYKLMFAFTDASK